MHARETSEDSADTWYNIVAKHNPSCPYDGRKTNEKPEEQPNPGT